MNCKLKTQDHVPNVSRSLVTAALESKFPRKVWLGAKGKSRRDRALQRSW